MMSSITSSMMLRSPRAPVSFFIALRAIATRASSVKSRLQLSRLNIF